MSTDPVLDAPVRLDLLALGSIEEARRQIEICNACRYCEGFCSVFPAMTRNTEFPDGEITHLANLCHNCRGCYYSCQYTAPHEFDLNVPAALAKVRQESWERFAWPQPVAHVFHRSGTALILALVAGLGLILAALQLLRPAAGAGFYAVLAHNAMVAIFVPAFLLPLLAIGFSLRRYWQSAGGGAIRLSHILMAFSRAATLRNLSGGQGQGCNFELEDRYTDRRRWFHQAMMYGFLLCFAATSAATVMHYALGLAAPYALFSLPKVLGIAGGVLMVIGTVGLGWLKVMADPALGARDVRNGEFGFILLLGLVALSGLALYAATGTRFVGTLLAVHLSSVLVLFLLLPFSKMAHGFFRLAALIADEIRAGRR
jgi:citrate/tricarballylate utilization protein